MKKTMLHRHRTFKMLKDIQIALLVQKFILPTGGVALERVVRGLFWKDFFWDFFTLWNVFGYFGSVLASHPTVHSGRASRGRVFGCTCWHWWHVTCSTWYRTSELWHFFFGNFIFLFVINSTICTCHENQCLVYAGIIRLDLCWSLCITS